ncbi:MAG: TIGR03545 family protein [Endomicrobiales bacterium]
MRRSFVIPVLVLILSITAFNIFFLDALIKRLAVSAGQKIFAARVEIAGVKTRFSKLSVTLSGITVADKSDPWKNLFEVRSMRFAMKPLPLLAKKVIIDEMAIDGIRWGTKRATSGALPPRAAERIEKENAKESENGFTARLAASLRKKASAEIAALPPAQALGDARNAFKDFSVEKLITLADLSSLKEMESMKSGIEQKYSGYQSRLQDLKLEDKVNRAVAASNEVTRIRIETPADVEPARQKIAALARSRDELQKTADDLRSLQSSFNADLGRQNDLLNSINALKDRDIKALSSKLQLPSLTMANVSYSLFGPAWVGRVSSFVHYVQVARKYMPPRKKEDKTMVRTRMKGMDVTFPRENVPPDFLIQRISLSGSTGGEGKDGAAMDFRGIAENITSDPVLLGRPTTFEISGSQEERRLLLKGNFDHARQEPVDTLTVQLSGLNAENFGIPDSEYLPSFDRSLATVASSLTLTAGTLDSDISMTLSGVQPRHGESPAGTELASVLGSLWTGITSISVNARLWGTPEELSMSVSSDIDRMLAERLKSIYGEKLAEMQNRLKAEVDRLTNEKKNELLSEFSSRREALQKELSGRQNELQSRINALQSQADSKENEMRGLAEKEKNKAEDELKKKAEEEIRKRAGDQLNNLFK